MVIRCRDVAFALRTQHSTAAAVRILITGIENPSAKGHISFHLIFMVANDFYPVGRPTDWLTGYLSPPVRGNLDKQRLPSFYNYPASFGYSKIELDSDSGN